MFQGSCLCGDVTWEAEGPLALAHHCHCGRCRKTHGAGFATFAAAPAAGFRLHGTDNVTRWDSSSGSFRSFCRRCGSVVPEDPWEDLVFVPLGALEGDPGVRPEGHIFVASKAPWTEIRDGLPCFDAYPEGVEATALPDRAPLDPPGATRGSCLCGSVGYVLEGEIAGCRLCHCSRCRKGRAAAHAANLFLPMEGLRFTRGEELLGSFKVPEALRFRQAFCSRCGSLMPHRSPERGLAIVPMGSLDDDPGVRPSAHIFVASKAPWFEITGDLPRYEEYPPGA